MNTSSSFMKGMGAGFIIGAGMGMAMMPKKKSHSLISKALRAAGELVDNVSDMMG